MSNIQPKIERLLKILSKNDKNILSVFDINSGKIKGRRNLFHKHTEFKQFELNNNCKIDLAPYGFIISHNHCEYLAYYKNNSVIVEKKKD